VSCVSQFLLGATASCISVPQCLLDDVHILLLTFLSVHSFSLLVVSRSSVRPIEQTKPDRVIDVASLFCLYPL
jgi:hypothetical protein